VKLNTIELHADLKRFMGMGYTQHETGDGVGCWVYNETGRRRRAKFNAIFGLPYPSTVNGPCTSDQCCAPLASRAEPLCIVLLRGRH